jgi:hypothetical protein
MEILTAIIVLAVVGLPAWGVIWFLSALFGPERAAKPNASVEQDDPNWEDHIRHDPYHPAGNQGFDNDDDYQDEEH